MLIEYKEVYAAVANSRHFLSLRFFRARSNHIAQRYDIIGDIHGHANDLRQLLRHMEYVDSGGYFEHPSRKAIFLGDFIDRGINQAAVLDMVMPMVANGAALAVMGNHEFNALAFHTLHPSRPSAWLRERNNKNISQHLAFLKDYSSPSKADQLQQVLDFFMSLPLWLEIDGLRVVHACWDEGHIATMRTLDPVGKLSPESLVEAATRGTPAYRAVETLLKGVEVDLPEGTTFTDKDGHERSAVRVQWWNREATCLGDAALPPGVPLGSAADLPLPESVPVYGEDAPPCFVGHYWLRGAPAPLVANVACLDYSVARNGKLVAYRWDGERVLAREKFAYSDL